MSMFTVIIASICICGLNLVGHAQAQYEDVRCKCVCPNPAVVNGSSSDRKLYIANVSPSLCDCDHVVLPALPANLTRGRELCPLCECKYESRNTTTIKVVVILVICIISMLVIYMGFISCLEPMLSKRGSTGTGYQEQTNDEDDLRGLNARPLYEQGSSLNRTGISSRQTRWKRQVQEQRKNIYVRRTMLN